MTAPTLQRGKLRFRGGRCLYQVPPRTVERWDSNRSGAPKLAALPASGGPPLFHDEQKPEHVQVESGRGFASPGEPGAWPGAGLGVAQGGLARRGTGRWMCPRRRGSPGRVEPKVPRDLRPATPDRCLCPLQGRRCSGEACAEKDGRPGTRTPWAPRATASGVKGERRVKAWPGRPPG